MFVIQCLIRTTFYKHKIYLHFCIHRQALAQGSACAHTQTHIHTLAEGNCQVKVDSNMGFVCISGEEQEPLQQTS